MNIDQRLRKLERSHGGNGPTAWAEVIIPEDTPEPERDAMIAQAEAVNPGKGLIITHIV